MSELRIELIRPSCFLEEVPQPMEGVKVMSEWPGQYVVVTRMGRASMLHTCIFLRLPVVRGQSRALGFMLPKLLIALALSVCVSLPLSLSLSFLPCGIDCRLRLQTAAKTQTT